MEEPEGLQSTGLQGSDITEATKHRPRAEGQVTGERAQPGSGFLWGQRQRAAIKEWGQEQNLMAVLRLEMYSLK